MTTFIVALATLYGLLLGSFINAVAWRVPRGESLNTRSHCPKCEGKITAWQNIPLLSYAILRGKCRHCGVRISLRYPAVELSGAVAFGVVSAYFTPSLLDRFGTAAGLVVLVAFLILTASSIALSIIDIEHQLLPNVIVYPTLFALVAFLSVAALMAGEPQRILDGLLGMLILGAFYGVVWFWKPGAMGFGDVRLSWIVGFVLAWWSWSALLLGAFAAFFFASILGLGLMAFQSAGRKTALPFGPWMLLGLWAGLTVGDSLVDMYLSLGGFK